MRIQRRFVDEIARHATEAFPVECCGFLIGLADDGGTVKGVVRAQNVASQPDEGYDVDPEEFARADADAEGKGWEVIGVYHSHPNWAACPSMRDVDAFWSGVAYVIVAVSADGATGVAAWTLDGTAGGRARQVDLIVEGSVAGAGEEPD